MSTEANRALFLSYASQDAAVARRICEQLRSAGVDAWFDQEGGLEHGDEWDVNIRRQIKECVFFLPIISAATQARLEGYFRIEWELAAERAMGIAQGVPFILPIVIDETAQEAAHVPDRFRRVQWARISGGALPPDVLARFVKLWNQRTGSAPAGAGAGRVLSGGSASRRPRWGIAAAILALAAAGFGWWRFHPAPAPALSPARRQAAQAAALWNKQEYASLEDWKLADQLCQQAIALDPFDGEVWAVDAQVCCGFLQFEFDASAARREAARDAETKAMTLAPHSDNALFARAAYYTSSSSTRQDGIELLRQLVDRHRADPRMLCALASALAAQQKFPEALACYDQALAVPGEDPSALLGKQYALDKMGRFADAEKIIDQALAIRPNPYLMGLRIYYMVMLDGDLKRASGAIRQMPPGIYQTDAGAELAMTVFLYDRDKGEAARVLKAYPKDYFEGPLCRGPKDYYLGLVHRMAGRTEAAQLCWTTALSLVEERLGSDRKSAELLRWKAELLALSGNREEAAKTLHLYQQLQGDDDQDLSWEVAPIAMLLGRQDEVLRFLGRQLKNQDAKSWDRNRLRFDPVFDPLRSDPRFAALVKQGS